MKKGSRLWPSSFVALPRIFLAGLGRSGAVIRAFASRLAKAGHQPHVVFDSSTPALAADDFLLIASGSGSTRTMVTVLDEAQQRECKVAVITANVLSPLARAADLRIVLPPMLPPESLSEDALIEPLQTLFEHSLFLGAGCRGPGARPAA